MRKIGRRARTVRSPVISKVGALARRLGEGTVSRQAVAKLRAEWLRHHRLHRRSLQHLAAHAGSKGRWLCSLPAPMRAMVLWLVKCEARPRVVHCVEVMVTATASTPTRPGSHSTVPPPSGRGSRTSRFAPALLCSRGPQPSPWPRVELRYPGRRHTHTSAQG